MLKKKAETFQISESMSDLCIIDMEITELILSADIGVLHLENSTIASVVIDEGITIPTIAISNCTISDNLQLSGVNKLATIHISESSIENINLSNMNIQAFTLIHSRISGNVLLTGCRITDEITISSTRIQGCIKLDSASIMCPDGFVCTHNTVNGNIELSDTIVKGQSNLSHSEMNNLTANDFESRGGGFSLANSKVNGNLQLQHAVIDGIADFNGIVVCENSDVKYTVFHGLFDAANSKWLGNLNISYYAGELSGKRMQFKSGIHFDNSFIKGNLLAHNTVNSGEMLFIDTEIQGKYEQTNSQISGIAVFQRTKFANTVNFTGSRFHSQFLLDTIKTKSVQLDRTYHNDYVTIKNSEINHFFHGRDSHFARGLKIYSSRFHEEFVLQGSTIESELIVHNSTFHSKFHLKKLITFPRLELIEISESHFDGIADLSNTNITADKTVLKDCYFGRKFLWRESMLNIPEISFINLEFSSSVDFRATEFSLPNCLSLTRVTTENILLTRDQLQNALYMAKIKGDMKEKAWRYERNAETYHWTKDVFAWNRKYSDQDWAIYHYLRENTKKNICKGLSRPLGISRVMKAVFVDYLGIYLFWRLACGFGLRLRYMIGASTLIIGMFAVAYSMNPDQLVICDEAYNTMIRSNQIQITAEEVDAPRENYQTAFTVNLVQSLEFSASTFTAMASGAMFTKISSPLNILVITEGLLGVLFTTLFIGSAIRKVIRTV